MNTNQQEFLNWAAAAQNWAIATKNLDDQRKLLITWNNKISAVTGLQAMATAAQNADGSLGAADGTPNNAHPITVGNLNKPANAFSNLLNTIQQSGNLYDNLAVTSGDHRANLEAIAD